MNESTGSEQPLGSTGRDFLTRAAGHQLSRRNMIKASVVAGGLVWSAPMLLTGKAFAATPHTCCPSPGTLFRLRFSEQEGVNCGPGCVSDLPEFSKPPASDEVDCKKEFADCLFSGGFITKEFTEGNVDRAEITLTDGVTLVAAGVKTSSHCYVTVCPTFATGRDTGTPNLCNGGTCPPPHNTPPNRIWVQTGPGPGETTIIVETHDDPDGTLNQVELVVCLSPLVTARC